jgi:DNA gyrase subunit A
MKGENMEEINLTDTIKESFVQFSGAVLQSRALVDARDCVKPSTRQIFYCLYTDGFTHDKPFKKTLKAIGSAFRLYIHGDSSAEGIIMRAGQPFAMRYPLVEVEGSSGTLLASGSWSAPRYTSARLSPLAEYLFKDIKKDTIKEWRDNYDDTEKYPMTLPSKGYFNLVNGAYGIGVGASSSIPQYNLRELNNALITLLWNPNAGFEDIYVAPDFATGGLLLNAEEVKESHRVGHGSACKLRAVVDYDKSERCFIVREIPYMVYTETICKQLEEIVNGDENPGIDRFNDLTGATALIKIYLSRKANPSEVLRVLYKKTSLQSHYGINFTMLEEGRFPKNFTWKELLQAHLDHEKEVYVRAYRYDLKKIEERLHIIKGLVSALNMIDEVVKTIKGSKNTNDAKLRLCELLDIDNVQATAILKITLSRLTHMEVNKLLDEQKDLEDKKARILAILGSEELLKKEIEKGLREVADKFGDARRTKLLNVEKDEEEEPQEVRQILAQLSDDNCIYATEQSSLYKQKRGGTGVKVKGKRLISSAVGDTDTDLLLFSDKGRFYSAPASKLPLEEEVAVEQFFDLGEDEKIKKIVFSKNDKTFVVFVTKKGFIKKSKLSDYLTKRKKGAQAIKIEDGDEIVSVFFINDEKACIVSEKGALVYCETINIPPLGRVARGVIGMRLDEGDSVVSAEPVSESDEYVCTITKDGYIKKTSLKGINVIRRGGKGIRIHNVKDSKVASLVLLPKEKTSVIISSETAKIKVGTDEIPTLGRQTRGVKSIKLNDSSVISLSKI